MYKGFVIAAAFLSLFLAGCKKQTEISLDERNALSLAPDVRWAVVKEPYVTYRADKSWETATGGYERKGQILQVLGTSNDKDGGVWFKFYGGYLPASAITIEPNRYRAERTSKAIKE